MHNIITDNEPERNDESPVDATKLHSSLHLARVFGRPFTLAKIRSPRRG